MNLSVFAAETKTCQGLVCPSDCALELLTCPSSLTNGLRLPQEYQHKQKWEASHSHALTPASELRPAFYLETFSQTCHPPLVLPQTVFPIHDLAALQPFSSYHLSNLGSRWQQENHSFYFNHDICRITQTTPFSDILSYSLPSSDRGSGRLVKQLCAHLSYLYCFFPRFLVQFLVCTSMTVHTQPAQCKQIRLSSKVTQLLFSLSFYCLFQMWKV